MQITSSFRRRLGTSRRFVFENIMDLEHVCVLHKRWFRNLRIIQQGPQYVEYRLTSLFYGLRQEILVRGAPIDADHYWYEFLGPLAQIRVDGEMHGPDGELTLTENITYRFSWWLAPLFWILSPFFRHQKEDILLADSRLLERVYELEQAGFERLVDRSRKQVVVYGGNGFFGRLVVEDLLQHTSANIVVASRSATIVDFHQFRSRVTFAESDINDYNSVLTTIEGAAVVVCCTGPYQGMPLHLLRACIEKRISYIDVADDRDFFLRCQELSSQVEAAGIMAFVGCSVVPGMSCLLTRYLREEFTVLEGVRIFITPGTRHPRGRGSFLSLASTFGKEYPIPVPGGQKLVRGWTEREEVFFPPPVGRRFVYFVVDIPDYVLQPHSFQVSTVEFKIGSELDSLNLFLSVILWTKQLLHLRSLDWFVPLARLIVYLASMFGTSQGAVMVEVSGKHGATARTIWLSVFAEEHGEIIPAILASIATEMILNGEIQGSGLAGLHDWLPKERFIAELKKRGVKIALRRGGSGEWAA